MGKCIYKMGDIVVPKRFKDIPHGFYEVVSCRKNDNNIICEITNDFYDTSYEVSNCNLLLICKLENREDLKCS